MADPAGVQAADGAGPAAARDAYARIVWSAGRPIHLIPLDSPAVRAELGDDWRMLYRFNSKKRGEVILKQEEVLHIRDLSVDGVTSLSRMKLADRAIRLALDAEQAASRIFETGNMAGGAIEVPNALSDGLRAHAHLPRHRICRHAAAQRWMLLEENAKANKFGSTAQEAQHVENRSAQVEEVARLYGVPRPLLFLSDTSWGTGIEQLGIFFLQYTMLEHFTNWEQAVARSLIDERDLERYQPKFNVRAPDARHAQGSGGLLQGRSRLRRYGAVPHAERDPRPPGLSGIGSARGQRPDQPHDTEGKEQ